MQRARPLGDCFQGVMRPDIMLSESSSQHELELFEQAPLN